MLAFLSEYASKSLRAQKRIRLRRYPVRRTATMSSSARRFYAIEPLNERAYSALVCPRRMRECAIGGAIGALDAPPAQIPSHRCGAP